MCHTLLVWGPSPGKCPQRWFWGLAPGWAEGEVFYQSAGKLSHHASSSWVQAQTCKYFCRQESGEARESRIHPTEVTPGQVELVVSKRVSFSVCVCGHGFFRMKQFLTAEWRWVGDSTLEVKLGCCSFLSFYSQVLWLQENLTSWWPNHFLSLPLWTLPLPSSQPPPSRKGVLVS